MKSVSLEELSEPVRNFLIGVERDRGLLVQDREGRVLLNILPCRPPSREERERAWVELSVISKRVGDHLRTLGVTVEEVEREMLGKLERSRGRTGSPA